MEYSLDNSVRAAFKIANVLLIIGGFFLMSIFSSQVKAVDAPHSDISVGGRSGSSDLFFVGQVLIIQMTSNYVTSVTASVSEKNGTGKISPVWGNTKTTANGDWIGYLLPFTDEQEGDWVLTVQTDQQTITKEFKVIKQYNNGKFDFSSSSQFEQVGGIAGKQFITNAKPNGSVYFSADFYPADITNNSGGRIYGEVGKIKSNGSFEFQGTSSQNIRVPNEVGIWVAQADVDGYMMESVIEVSPNPALYFHPPGSNVLSESGEVYFINNQYYKVPYTSGGAYLSFKFNTWSNLPNETEADKMLVKTTDFYGSTDSYRFVSPREGVLINDQGTVYIMTAQGRAGFTSSKVFTDLGYSFDYVYPGDTSFLRTLDPISDANRFHPEGTLVNIDGTVYLIGSCYENTCQRLPFPSMEVFDSWGYWPEDIVKGNSFDRALSVGSPISKRPSDRLSLGGAH